MHTIHLREPWEIEPLPQGTRYRRWFNQPTGLAPGDHVRLVLAGLAGEAFDAAIGEIASVRLNDFLLTAMSPGVFEIAEHLRGRNCATIDIDTASPTQRPFTACLQIKAADDVS